MRAMELNAVQVDNNKAAFEWGHRCAHDLARVQALFKAQQVIALVKKPSLPEMRLFGAAVAGQKERQGQAAKTRFQHGL